ncbi:DgyrCDS8530 [Dimorphilus gyrociliatus]|uniref:DgyrCDS8530 n=1 Tax=Dimorphilus gyrociliatus TaxID=2664684 RepID=A0A7I8VUF3_9ANNE|nr:DgyrCDS8530 [Dimorphilus gyrociliatus]
MEIFCQCPDGWELYEINNKAYCIGADSSTNGFSWVEAKACCEGAGAIMVKVEQDDMNKFVGDVIEKLPDSNFVSGFWLGIKWFSDEPNDVPYLRNRYFDRTMLTFQNYKNGIPNVDNCASISPSDAKWSKRTDCYESNGVVCQQAQNLMDDNKAKNFNCGNMQLNIATTAEITSPEPTTTKSTTEMTTATSTKVQETTEITTPDFTSAATTAITNGTMLRLTSTIQNEEVTLILSRMKQQNINISVVWIGLKQKNPLLLTNDDDEIETGFLNFAISNLLYTPSCVGLSMKPDSSYGKWITVPSCETPFPVVCQKKVSKGLSRAKPVG